MRSGRLPRLHVRPAAELRGAPTACSRSTSTNRGRSATTTDGCCAPSPSRRRSRSTTSASCARRRSWPRKDGLTGVFNRTYLEIALQRTSSAPAPPRRPGERPVPRRRRPQAHQRRLRPRGRRRAAARHGRRPAAELPRERHRRPLRRRRVRRADAGHRRDGRAPRRRQDHRGHAAAATGTSRRIRRSRRRLGVHTADGAGVEDPPARGRPAHVRDEARAAATTDVPPRAPSHRACYAFRHDELPDTTAPASSAARSCATRSSAWPPVIEIDFIDGALHDYPDRMRATLQDRIDAIPGRLRRPAQLRALQQRLGGPLRRAAPAGRPGRRRLHLDPARLADPLPRRVLPATPAPTTTRAAGSTTSRTRIRSTSR